MSWGSDSSDGLSSAPTHWLWAGIVAAVVGVTLFFVPGGLIGSIVGWLLGGTVAVLLLAVFNQADATRLATGWATPSSGAGTLRVILLVLAVAAVGLNAWQIADVAARHQW